MPTLLGTASKGTLLAVAISCITAGTKFVGEDLWAGIALLVVGIVLVIVWAVLIDKQAKEAGEKAAEKAVKHSIEVLEKREKE